MELINKQLTISIASKDRPEVVEATLRKIHDFGLGDCPLILCDDGSSPQLNPPALALFQYGRLLRNEIAQGQALARNRIAEESKTPFILQLDDDSYPFSGDLNQLIQFASTHDDLLGLALALEEPARKRSIPRLQPSGDTLEVRAFVGCAVMLVTKRFLELGGYAAWIERTVEEEELCLRGTQRGLRILWSSKVHIRHAVTPVQRMPSSICFRSFRNWTVAWCLHAPKVVLPWRLTRLLGGALFYSLRGLGSHSISGFAAGLRLARRLPCPRDRLSLSSYRRFQSLPHALALFDE